MVARFSVLASGSSGNASLLQAGDFGLLVDAGLNPRLLTSRLAAVGASWRSVRAALLTHTHGDHWNDRSFGQLLSLRAPLWCHPGHHEMLSLYSPAFLALKQAGLVHAYEAGEEFEIGPGLLCRPLPVQHDSEPTFGFRFAGSPDLFGPTWSLGFLSDLGCWAEELVRQVADVDVLAVEFNHDVRMERQSRRPAHLIARVLGDDGHLSNAQAADFLRAALAVSAPGKLRHVIQLHLSRDCNRPELAAAAAEEVLAGLPTPVQVHTASQGRTGPMLRLDLVAQPPRLTAVRRGVRRSAL
jgi:phosphoribosyl 1,2-cyclic phosphodiesterase